MSNISLDNILTEVRLCQFNIHTEKELANHRFVKDAEEGRLQIDQLKTFICEQFYIQQYDLKSLQRMVDRSKEEGKLACQKFFELLCEGEKYASLLIKNMACWLKLSDDDLSKFPCKMKAQAYPSYLSRCSIYETPAFVAVACAVTFPAWGRMCGRVFDSIKKNPNKFSQASDKDIEFLKFFATPINGFDQMAIDCLKEEISEDFEIKSLKTVVRLLQEAEVLFWDSVYGK